jgi:NaMN:DMB phosphoribosyltransferase
MASLTDCLIIGESVPGGTTTALAVLKALGYDAKVSSSIPNNPVELKNQIATSALERIDSDHPYSIVAKVGDPMIPFVAGMLSSASSVSNVMLAGGTQMAAVLACDESANFTSLVTKIADIPAISVNPGLENSQHAGLKAFSEGFAKEGVGAGGSIISSMIKTGNDSTKFLEITEKEYHRLFTLQ